MRIVLFDCPEDRIKLYPLTLTRPIGHLRVGILRIFEKWQLLYPDAEITISTDAYLSEKYGEPTKEEALWIRAGFLPSERLINRLEQLDSGQRLSLDGEIVAFYGTSLSANYDVKDATGDGVFQIEHTWDIFRLNGLEIRADYQLLTKDRTSAPITDPHTITYGSEIYLEEGATTKAAVLNAESGPIYIGKNAEIQEGSVIRGPFALGESSVISLGSKIRPDTTVGPFCKVGGEVSNSVIFGYSSKGHDGYLGNAVIGEWCNLGANTNNSNLKNNYANVKMWDFEQESMADSGLQFCGLIMGDHCKSGINTMFNTGTTVGACSNVFGSGYPKTYIPPFSWGGAAGFTLYNIDKAFETADLMMTRKKLSLSDKDKAILKHIFEHFSTH